MEIEALLKILTLIAAIFALPKILRELSDQKFSRLVSNFTFTKEFVEATKSNPHPLVVEVGYRTIYPGTSLSSPEILYLLSFHRPTRAFRLFNRGQPYLRFVDGVPESQPNIGFGDNYLNKGYRTFLKCWYLLCYFFFALLAFTPLIFIQQLLTGSWQVAVGGAIGMLVIFGSIAALSLGKYAAVFAAENFIEFQQDKF